MAEARFLPRRSDQVVPWVEAGFPGSVPIASIEELLRVTIDYPTDSLAARLHRAVFSHRRFGRASVR